jgi:hypothetical protein
MLVCHHDSRRVLFYCKPAAHILISMQVMHGVKGNGIALRSAPY